MSRPPPPGSLLPALGRRPGVVLCIPLGLPPGPDPKRLFWKDVLGPVIFDIATLDYLVGTIRTTFGALGQWGRELLRKRRGKPSRESIQAFNKARVRRYLPPLPCVYENESPFLLRGRVHVPYIHPSPQIGRAEGRCRVSPSGEAREQVPRSAKEGWRSIPLAEADSDRRLPRVYSVSLILDIYRT